MSRLDSFIRLAKKAMDSASSSSPARGNGQVPSDWGSQARPAASGPGAAADPLTPPPAPGSAAGAPSGSADDRAAIARYDYLLRTARPDQIEQVHHEAFSRLTPDQREQIAAHMRAELPAHERPRTAQPTDLARTAARAEAAHPGRLRGLLARTGGAGRGVAGAAFVGGGALGAVAGAAVMGGVGAAMLGQAAAAGIDFDALAQGVDLDAIAQGAGDFLPGAGEYVQGIGDHVAEAGSGIGDLASGLGLPGLDDLFGR
ncbi:cation-transporting ATPase [Microbacterium stercoris]|uniref:cation-transporting ATPase n=1 Tax=Microbacterium stercoris TaxID=2820289 RepID=UPI001F469642|nr:cation-transporting ATPase [Microbacterium stercoris]